MDNEELAKAISEAIKFIGNCHSSYDRYKLLHVHLDELLLCQAARARDPLTRTESNSKLQSRVDKLEAALKNLATWGDKKRTMTYVSDFAKKALEESADDTV